MIETEEPTPYAFFVGDEKKEVEVTASVSDAMNDLKDTKYNSETVLPLIYKPEAMFRVRPVTRASATLEGHADAILSVTFSPDGKSLATGGGDNTVRIWDIFTEMPGYTMTGHTHWVQCVRYSPDCEKVASGGMDKTVRIWNPKTGEAIGTPLRGHKKYVTSLSWEPMHKNINCKRVASASNDGSVKVWNVATGGVEMSFTGHSDEVTHVIWGGEGLIYSASKDRTIKVWSAVKGVCVRTLTGHAHWVNTLALSTEYVLRSACYDHTNREFNSKKEM